MGLFLAGRPPGPAALLCGSVFKHAALPVLLLVVGCSAGESARRKDLPYALDEFNAALRWKHMPAAMRWVEPQAVPEISRGLSALPEDVEIVDVELGAVRPSADGLSAECVVKYSWYRQRDTTLQSGFEIQGWRDTGEGWTLMYRIPPADPKLPRSPFVAVVNE